MRMGNTRTTLRKACILKVTKKTDPWNNLHPNKLAIYVVIVIIHAVTWHLSDVSN